MNHYEKILRSKRSIHALKTTFKYTDNMILKLNKEALSW